MEQIAEHLINRHHRVILSRRTYRREGDGASMLETTEAVADDGRLIGIQRDAMRIDPSTTEMKVRGQWVAYRPSDYLTGEVDLEIERAPTRRVWRTLSDADFAAESARLMALPTHTLEVWLTPIQRGRVSLAGSRDRWIYATGEGGYLENARGAYASVDEAEAACRAHLESLREQIAQGIRRIFAPVAEITITMPPIGIEVIGDTSQVFAPPPPRRAERRAMARALGQLGGQSTSEAKVAAARANGAKGGRPKKTK